MCERIVSQVNTIAFRELNVVKRGLEIFFSLYSHSGAPYKPASNTYLLYLNTNAKNWGANYLCNNWLY